MAEARVVVPAGEDIKRAREVGRREHEYDGAELKFDRGADELNLRLVSGLRLLIPRRLILELAELPKAVAAEMKLGVQGGAIEVASKDIDISVRGLTRDLVGANIAAKGGQARTEAKRAAAQANGRLGGRPRKTVPTEFAKIASDTRPRSSVATKQISTAKKHKA